MFFKLYKCQSCANMLAYSDIVMRLMKKKLNDRNISVTVTFIKKFDNVVN